MILPILLAVTTFTSHECGVSFVLPRHWTAQATDECDVALRPAGWSRIAKKSRWSPSDPPLVLVLFERGMSFDQALEEKDFEPDEGGYAIHRGQGNAVAEPYVAGQYSGLVARVFSRIFIDDDARVRDDEPRAVGHDIEYVVLKAPGGRVIGFDCPGGSPDEPIDCDAIIRQVLPTLRLAP